MKKIIPFTKDIKFNTKIYEITSISLEHNLTIQDNNIITGEFIVSGDYKMNDSSVNTEPFIHGLPFDITLDCKYDMDRIKIDIDDFKFEIINEEILRVNIDVLIEGVEIVEMLDEEEITPDYIIEARNNDFVEDDFVKEEDTTTYEDFKLENDVETTIEENTVDIKEDNMNDSSNIDLFKQTDEKIEEVSKLEDVNQVVDSIFNNFSEKDEKYVSYYVHIVRENENIQQICNKYKVSIDKVKEYNDIDTIALGNKIIIPYIENEAN